MYVGLNNFWEQLTACLSEKREFVLRLNIDILIYNARFRVYVP
jgi:hypothetical protein